ncbi:MAG: DUF1007 family protein [Pseudomonadota bacterium]
MNGITSKIMCLSAMAWLTIANPAQAHPHVFVDGGVDFRFDDEAQLTSLQVTWLYDEFETLYILANNDLDLTLDGTLSEADRLVLEQKFSEWPEDFDGSAHLTHEGAPVALGWPSDPQVQVIDGRIQAVFDRTLESPLALTGETLELAFYESTYFFAFKITNSPQLFGTTQCIADMIPFTADPGDSFLLAKLASLSREEIPENENVGRLFADRIALTCN